MLEMKGNYKGKHSDLICRWCNNAMETQQGILKKFPKFQGITRNTYFNDEAEATSTAKDIIQKVKTKLSKCSGEGGGGGGDNNTNCLCIT